MSRLLTRKSAIAAMVLGSLEAFRVARAQSGVARAPSSANGPIDLAAINAQFGSVQGLKAKLDEVDQLKAQIAALATRVTAVETKQSQTFGFTKTANGYVFAPNDNPNVTIQAMGALAIKGANVNVGSNASTVMVTGATISHTATTISHTASMIKLN